MIAKILLGLAALPIVIYPGIFMAGIMGLAAEAGPRDSPWVLLLVRVCLWLSLLYPVAYVISLLISARWTAQIGATVIVTYLAVCVALFMAWYSLSD